MCCILSILLIDSASSCLSKSCVAIDESLRWFIVIKRDLYLNRIIKSMWNGEVKVISGIRRCGKPKKK